MAALPVLIVDEDRRWIEACRSELEGAGCECHVVRGGAEDVTHPFLQRPELVVLAEIASRGRISFRFIARLHERKPELPIVVVTTQATQQCVIRAIRSGALGYVVKHDVAGRVIDVVQTVQSGGAPLGPAILRRLIMSFHGASVRRTPHLTMRERDVLEHLADGCTYGECGRRLDISVDTVRTHVRNVYDKLQVGTKSEAVAIAMREGILP